MKLRRKLMLIALTALMAMPFNAFAEEGEEALALSDKYATEAGIELILNKPITGEDIIPVITPENEEAVKGNFALKDDGKRIVVTMPENEKFELDKKYNIDVLGITDGENLLSFKTDLTLNMLFKDDFESYADTAQTERVYQKLLTEHLDREIGAGTTLWGIHKDDIDITINGRSARMFASQGQQRSLALAMKLAEGEVSAGMFGENPVFLLDDVFSELDTARRSYLSGKIRDRQVIITTCEPGGIAGGRIIRVENGIYQA